MDHQRGEPVPHTIVRATQSHELIAKLLRAAERLPVAPLPLRFRFQPVAAADVASRITELARAQPAGHVADFGGPEVRAWRRPLVCCQLFGAAATG
jgi:uncharacterized protein YbjT (DUF2867 family)